LKRFSSLKIIKSPFLYLGFEANFFGFSLWFVLFFFEVVLFCVFVRPSKFFCFYLGVFDSWHVAKLSSLGSFEALFKYKGLGRDHLVGGEDSLPIKKAV
jgi:hypothetical protein